MIRVGWAYPPKKEFKAAAKGIYVVIPRAPYLLQNFSPMPGPPSIFRLGPCLE